MTFFASISRCTLHWLQLRKLFWFTNGKALIKSRKKRDRKCHLSSSIVGELSLYFPGPAGSSLREKISPQDHNPPRRLKTITVRSSPRTVSPGPEIVFQPPHQKSSANFGKCSANFTKRQCNIHTKGQFKLQLDFFFASESVSVPLNKEPP